MLIGFKRFLAERDTFFCFYDFKKLFENKKKKKKKVLTNNLLFFNVR